jgi:UDPglucose--hexose-1-phosphate uridylyltransferase
MLQSRKDPIKNNRVAIATKRQGRTFLPSKDYCPLCPTVNNEILTEIPSKEYNIAVFENKFPTFSRNPDPINNSNCAPFYMYPSKGICEVVCYTQNHYEYLEDQPLIKIENLIKVWIDRYYDLGNKKYIKYVFIFENKGKETGVTLLHPHGQIYAFTYIPPIIKEELSSSKKYFKANNKCLHCVVIERELKDDKRIVLKNKNFVAFIPFYAKWPYEVHIYPLSHHENIAFLSGEEIKDLAKILKELINRYNLLFDFRMPYVMVIHQSPTNKKDYNYYHFHFEFYPPYRTNNKLKFLAGCELGAGTFINDTLPEEKAKELKDVKTRI